MLLHSIQENAALFPHAIALKNDQTALTYAELNNQIVQLSTQLSASTCHKTIAINVDNHPAWVVLDLAAITLAIPLVPLPSFFSDAQLLHAIQDAGAEVIITDNADYFRQLLGNLIIGTTVFDVAHKTLTQFTLAIASVALPASTSKVTYTSGTTGNPKGVCLSLSALVNVANSIKNAVGLNQNSQHCCVLPLSTLLENVAGVYAILLAGGTAHILPSAQVGFSGSSFDSQKLYDALIKSHANSVILLPELLKALVLKLESGAKKLADLRFIAVGGAHVSTQLLARAQRLEMPVFEGYGLSESASVVALNTPAANKIGSVGKPLNHVEITFSADQEILVKGANFLAYTNNNSATSQQQWLPTGDIGYCDDAGFLYINGRKKHIFITSFGRNVSPEWVERELTSQSCIVQACLFGEAKPWNTAVIVAQENVNLIQINQAVFDVNQTLPDYAQIKKFVLADAPFNISNQQLTPNGRLKRDAIWQQYQQQVNALYHD